MFLAVLSARVGASFGALLLSQAAVLENAPATAAVATAARCHNRCTRVNTAAAAGWFLKPGHEHRRRGAPLPLA